MADVVRTVREFQEVVYTVGTDSLCKAVLAWLSDEHDASFSKETQVLFFEDGVTVTTRYAQGIEARQGGDGTAPSRSDESPVGSADAPKSLVERDHD